MTRRKNTSETWHRLLEWDKSSSDAERLSGLVIIIRGYQNVDPQHPLGGPDGLKDIVCCRNQNKYIAAAYFPRGQKALSEIKTKFLSDLEGVKANQAAGMIFVTNQELSLSEREELQTLAATELDLIHLESLNLILNTPEMYGVRLEFLDITMEKEEQLAFMQRMFTRINELEKEKTELITSLHEKKENENETEKIVEAIPVHSDFFSPSLNLSSSTLTKVKICSQCKYGYIVERYNPNTVVFLHGYNQAAAICPKCGNAEYV